MTTRTHAALIAQFAGLPNLSTSERLDATMANVWSNGPDAYPTDDLELWERDMLEDAFKLAVFIGGNRRDWDKETDRPASYFMFDDGSYAIISNDGSAIYDAST